MEVYCFVVVLFSEIPSEQKCIFDIMNISTNNIKPDELIMNLSAVKLRRL